MASVLVSIGEIKKKKRHFVYLDSALRKMHSELQNVLFSLLALYDCDVTLSLQLIIGQSVLVTKN